MGENAANHNVNDSFFAGRYKELWRSFIPDELTRRELDFLFQYFNLAPGQKVLDIMCGYGRHAIGLARLGIRVTAVDNLREYIEEINFIAKKERLPLQGIQSGILQYQPAEKARLALCMGNSLNFFNEDDSVQLMKVVAAGLEEGGYFLVHTWSLAETVVKNFAEKSWQYNGDTRVLTDSAYLFSPTRIESEICMIGRDGTEETRQAVDYVFSYSEMQHMLHRAGFMLEEAFSIPGKKHYALGEPRAYIIARKKGD